MLVFVTDCSYAKCVTNLLVSRLIFGGTDVLTQTSGRTCAIFVARLSRTRLLLPSTNVFTPTRDHIFVICVASPIDSLADSSVINEVMWSINHISVRARFPDTKIFAVMTGCMFVTCATNAIVSPVISRDTDVLIQMNVHTPVTCVARHLRTRLILPVTNAFIPNTDVTFVTCVISPLLSPAVSSNTNEFI